MANDAWPLAAILIGSLAGDVWKQASLFTGRSLYSLVLNLVLYADKHCEFMLKKLSAAQRCHCQYRLNIRRGAGRGGRAATSPGGFGKIVHRSGVYNPPKGQLVCI